MLAPRSGYIVIDSFEYTRKSIDFTFFGTYTLEKKEVRPVAEVEIGKVSDFFARPVVAGIALTGAVKTGDTIRILGHTTDMEFTVDSMQIDNANVNEAKAGDLIGIKVPDRVRAGDTVYLVSG
jgi:translation elongation factor EF-Tu-like GTPase